MIAGELQFHGACGHGMTVPSAQAGTDVRCPHCDQVVRVPPQDVPYAAPLGPPGPGGPGGPVPVPAVRESAALRALYLTSLLIGVAGAAVVYLVMFDDLSEEQLVGVTPLWSFPIIFGAYGFISQRLIRLLVQGRAATLADAAKKSIDVAGYWAILALFPFLLLKWRNSLLVSLAASLFWALLLWIFFTAVFPTL
jgi:hypothetical protein